MIDRVDEGDRMPEIFTESAGSYGDIEWPLVRQLLGARREDRDLLSPITEWPWNQAESLKRPWVNGSRLGQPREEDGINIVDTLFSSQDGRLLWCSSSNSKRR